MAASKSTKSARSTAAGAAKGAARTAAKGAAKTAAKTTKSAAKSAAKAAGSRAVAAGGERIGRGTRWTEEQVTLLLDTVKGSATAKEAFETVARQLGKSTGTVQQKYYNLQKQAGGGSSRGRGRPRAAAASRGSSVAATRASLVPSAADMRSLSVDELVTMTTRVRDEVERRRRELDEASKLLPG